MPAGSDPGLSPQMQEAANNIIPIFQSVPENTADIALKNRYISKIGIWKIETFFWTAKKFLGFNDECHSTSYDAMTAHMTIVTVRYIILVIEQCKSEDKRTMGTLFAMLEEEQKDKEIGDILGTCCDVMFDALESANLTEKQMEVFVNEFMSHLPSQIFKYLTYASTFKDEDEESTATKRRKKRA